MKKMADLYDRWDLIEGEDGKFRLVRLAPPRSLVDEVVALLGPTPPPAAPSALAEALTPPAPPPDVQSVVNPGPPALPAGADAELVKMVTGLVGPNAKETKP